MLINKWHSLHQMAKIEFGVECGEMVKPLEMIISIY